ncbi:hypothetical protein [Micromonospora sp. WMMD1274]|uniref:hypothetical protein n=1 Tax=Micromonospora sp. WMMD1274 TaxID=3404116 RepID=UPI003B924CE6
MEPPQHPPRRPVLLVAIARRRRPDRQPAMPRRMHHQHPRATRPRPHGCPQRDGSRGAHPRRRDPPHHPRRRHSPHGSRQARANQTPHPDPTRPDTYRATLPCKCPPGQPIAGQHRRDCPITRIYDHLADTLDELDHTATQAREAYDELATLLPHASPAHLAEQLRLLDQATTALAQLRAHADRLTNPATAPR